ncbi:MAG: Guanylate kinase [Actinomycetota bacterium]|nr:Guanylate kinase [Actinomycetota bacterium]
MQVLAVIGPSGSGKSTAVRELHRLGVVTVTPSWTTRPRRSEEADGSLEHRFVSEREFTALDGAGFFLEVVRPFDLPFRYGLPQVDEPADGSVPAVMVRAPLVPLVARHFPDHVVYQVEDAYDRARERILAGRHEPGPSLGTRLDGYEDERLLGRALATRVFVNASSPADLVAAVIAAIDRDFPVKPDFPENDVPERRKP